MKTTHKSWLWPDRTIGKRESRELREEHNALVNRVASLEAAVKQAEAYAEACRDYYGKEHKDGDALADKCVDLVLAEEKYREAIKAIN